MTTRFSITVPYKDHCDHAHFSPVGSMFPQKSTAKSAFKIKLDFPVGATELLAFAPRDGEIDPRDDAPFYVLQIPVPLPDNRTIWRRIGLLFPERDGSKVAFRIKLNFPVGATEFVAFEPKDAEPEDNQEQ